MDLSRVSTMTVIEKKEQEMMIYKRFNNIEDSFSFDNISDIIIKNRNDLSSTVALRSANELDVTYQTPIGTGQPINVLDRIHIKDRIGLSSNFMVSDRNEMDVIYQTPTGIDDPYDVTSYFIAKTGINLNSRLFFTYHNEMDVLSNVAQAPEIILDIPPLQDTFNMESRPTWNRGGQTTLISGFAADGEYYTMIEWDLTLLKRITEESKYTIKDIEIIFAHPIPDMTGSFDMWKINGAWTEYDITWRLAERTIAWDRILTSRTMNGETVTYFSIYDMIMDNYIKVDNVDFNIGIKSLDWILILSRESSVPPTIRVTYFDNTWTGYSAQKLFHSKMTIRQKNNINLISRISFKLTSGLNNTIKFEPKKFKLKSTAKINSHNIELNIVKNTVKFNAMVPLEENFNSSLFVSGKESLDSTVTLTDLFIKSKMNIVQHNNLNSTITILSEPQFNEFNSTVRINLNNFPSFVKMVSMFPFLSTMNILQQEDLKSIAIIEPKNYDLISSILIKGQEQLMSTAEIELPREDLESRFKNTKLVEYLNSTLQINEKVIELTSQFTLGKTIHDLDSKFLVETPNLLLQSTAFFKSIKDLHNLVFFDFKNQKLDSQILIKGREVLSSILQIRSANLPSNIRVGSNNLFHSRAVFGYMSQQLSSIMHINQNGTFDLTNNTVIFNPREFYPLNSEIYIYGFNWKDLSSTLKIQLSGEENLQSLFNLYLYSELASTMETLYKYAFNSQMDIRQKDVYEFESKLKMIDQWSPDILSRLLIPVASNQDLLSKIIINQSARYWIPNVHGTDIFKFENRKLPRPWTGI